MNSAQKKGEIGGEKYFILLRYDADVRWNEFNDCRQRQTNNTKLNVRFIFPRSHIPLCNDGFIYNDNYIILLSKKYIQRISDFLFCILMNPEEVWQPHNMTKINHEKKLIQDTYKTFKDLNTVRVIYLLLDEREGKERGKNVVLNTRSSPWNKMNKS